MKSHHFMDWSFTGLSFVLWGFYETRKKVLSYTLGLVVLCDMIRQAPVVKWSDYSNLA